MEMMLRVVENCEKAITLSTVVDKTCKNTCHSTNNKHVTRHSQQDVYKIAKKNLQYERTAITTKHHVTTAITDAC